MTLKLLLYCHLGLSSLVFSFFIKNFPVVLLSDDHFCWFSSPLQGLLSLWMKGYVFSTKSSTPRSISKLMLTYKIWLKPQGLPAGCLRSPSWLGKETPFSYDPAQLPSCPTSFYQYKGWHCLQGATQITVPSSCIAPDPNPALGCPCSALPACTETSAAACRLPALSLVLRVALDAF